MYRYDEFDRGFVESRAAQFCDQVDRRLRGELSEDEFKPLRLQNGLYLQLHAYMLHIAIPDGVLSSDQLSGLAGIARDFDRGFGHFTTRQNIQFNWIRLVDAPNILDRLAAFDMHAIQTSGNCIRNVTVRWHWHRPPCSLFSVRRAPAHWPRAGVSGARNIGTADRTDARADPLRPVCLTSSSIALTQNSPYLKRLAPCPRRKCFSDEPQS